MNGANELYLRWVTLLPGVDAGMLARRQALLTRATVATEVEVDALRLRQELAAGESELLAEVTKRWGAGDILRAAQAEAQRSPLSRAVRQVDDLTLRDALKHMDGLQLGVEALIAFDAGQVLRLGGAGLPSDPEQLAAVVQRVLHWWTIAAQPALVRIANSKTKN